MDFAQADQRYEELKEEYESGFLSGEAFDEALREMMIQDPQGRWWAKGREVGDWHYYHEETSEWIKDYPPGYKIPAQAEKISSNAAAEATLSAAPVERTARVQAAALSQAESVSASPTPLDDTADPSPVPRQASKKWRWVIAGLVVLALLSLSLGVYLVLPGSSASVTSEGMALVPAGTYTVGYDSGALEHEAEKAVELPSYWIDKFETTNSQFAEYVAEQGVEAPAYWQDGTYPPGQATHPVRQVSWQTADDYCRWAGKRLPTEAEWEAAARFDKGWLYPWGSDLSVVGDLGAFDAFPGDGTYAVGTFLPDRNPLGAFGMAHNVHEWVDEPYADISDNERVLRGGSRAVPLDLASRLVGDPSRATMTDMAGFRCAADVDQVVAVPASDLLLHDDFDDPGSGWEVGAEGIPGYHAPDWYHVEASVPEPVVLIGTEGNSSRGNISMSAELLVNDKKTTMDGDFRYGLVVRQTSDDEYYAFTISPTTQRWAALRQKPEGQVLLGEGTDASIQGLSGRNLLQIDASGTTFAFSINGRLVHHFNDPEASSAGDIGFYVETQGASKAHILVESVDVTILPPDAIAASPVSQPIAAAPEAPTALPTRMPDTSPTEVPTIAVRQSPSPMPSPTPVPSPTPTPIVPLPSAQGMVMVDIDTYTTTMTLPGKLPRFWIDQRFWIDRYEVTNSQYAQFIEDTGLEPLANWPDGNIPTGLGDHPVEGIPWQRAADYCAWLNKRLPTEAEWEVAARGPHGWTYPWGQDEDVVQLPDKGTYAVGSILANRSFFGAYDMAGNVWEWVTEPYLDPDAVGRGERVMRGGAATYPADLATPLSGDPESSAMNRNAGIRCAASAVAVEAGEAEPVFEETRGPSAVFADDFTDITLGWPQSLEQVEAYFYGYHPTDHYHVEVNEANDCLSVPRELDAMPGDFMLDVEVFAFRPLTDEEGDFQYGIMLRQITRDEFYAFLIAPRSRHWQVLKSTSEGMAIMVEGDSSTIRGTGQETRDRLFAIANGPRMTFFINGELVADISDGDYTVGNAGLITRTFDNTKAHAHNDTFVLWDLPAGAVTSGTEPPTVADLVFDQSVCRGYFSDTVLLLNFTTHTVLPGENLTRISAEYGTTIEAIIKANNIPDANRIRSGWSLVIPLPDPGESNL